LGLRFYTPFLYPNFHTLVSPNFTVGLPLRCLAPCRWVSLLVGVPVVVCAMSVCADLQGRRSHDFACGLAKLDSMGLVPVLSSHCGVISESERIGILRGRVGGREMSTFRAYVGRLVVLEEYLVGRDPPLSLVRWPPDRLALELFALGRSGEDQARVVSC
jgi:hypothetical protein